MDDEIVWTTVPGWSRLHAVPLAGIGSRRKTLCGHRPGPSHNSVWPSPAADAAETTARCGRCWRIIVDQGGRRA